MFKHTPSPWYVHRNTANLVVVDPQGNFVARIQVPKFAPVDARLRVEADANLIAAAPEMLNALIEAKLVLAEKLRRLGAQPEVSSTYNKIRAAITKATGELA